MKNINQREYQNALFVHDNAGFVYTEMLFLSIGIGLHLFSIYAFLIFYLVSLFLVSFRFTRIFVLQGLNLAWGFVAFMVASQISDQAALLSALIMFVVMFRLHNIDNCWI